jgi:sucrose-6-phosphate hydrolase SacC (GH32 family)
MPADMPFSQGMFFPVSLSLRTTPDGLRMCPWPIAEIERLYDKKHEWHNLAVTSERSFSPDVNDELFDVDLVMVPSPEASVGIAVGGAVIRYDGQRLTCSGPGDAVWMAKIQPDAEGRISLRILKDRTTVEIFGSGGLVYMPIFALFDQERRSFQVTVAKGTCLIERLAVNTLKSIWNN